MWVRVSENERGIEQVREREKEGEREGGRERERERGRGGKRRDMEAEGEGWGEGRRWNYRDGDGGAPLFTSRRSVAASFRAGKMRRAARRACCHAYAPRPRAGINPSRDAMRLPRDQAPTSRRTTGVTGPRRAAGKGGVLRSSDKRRTGTLRHAFAQRNTKRRTHPSCRGSSSAGAGYADASIPALYPGQASRRKEERIPAGCSTTFSTAALKPLRNERRGERAGRQKKLEECVSERESGAGRGESLTVEVKVWNYNGFDVHFHPHFDKHDFRVLWEGASNTGRGTEQYHT